MDMLFVRHWWTFLIRGILAVLFGIGALLVPGIAFATLIILFGAYMFIDGIFLATAALSARRALPHWRWMLVSGLFSVVIGLITFLNPFVTAIAVLYLIAFWAIIAGILEIMAAVRLRRSIEGEGWYIATGILGIVLAILVFLFPRASAIMLTVFFGFYMITAGVLLISLSIRLRRRYHHGRLSPG